jgi:hypothetical protein
MRKKHNISTYTLLEIHRNDTQSSPAAKTKPPVLRQAKNNIQPQTRGEVGSGLLLLAPLNCDYFNRRFVFYYFSFSQYNLYCSIFDLLPEKKCAQLKIQEILVK